MSAAKLKYGAALVLALTAFTAGAVGYRLSAVDPRPTAEAPKSADEPKAESRKPVVDPLPAGVVARIGTTRFRHGDTVQCVAYSPEGKVLATGGNDEIVRLWEPGSGKPVRILQGHCGTVHALAFSKDGKLLASAADGPGSGVRVWDAATGARKFDLSGESQTVVFSPDDRKLLTAGREGTAKVWDVATGQQLVQLAEAKGWLAGAGFTAAGKPLVAYTDQAPGGKVRTWDVERGKELLALTMPEKELRVEAVAFARDGKTMVTASSRTGQLGERVIGTVGVLRQWDMATGEQVREFTAREPVHRIVGVGLSPDGKLLAAGSDDRSVRLWDLETGKHVRKYVASYKGFYYSVGIAFSPDGRTLAAAGPDSQSVQLWEMATGRALHDEPEGHDGWVEAIAVSPDGKRFASAGRDRTIRLWDAATGKQLGVQRTEYPIHALTFSPDGKWLVAGDQNKIVWLLDGMNAKEVRRLQTQLPTVTGLAFTRDGKTLAVGQTDPSFDGKSTNRIELWDPAAGRVLRMIEEGEGKRCWLEFAPDGKTLISAHEDKKFRIWQTDTAKKLSEFEVTGHRHWFHAAAFSADGRLAATNGFDGIIKVWELATGKPVQNFHVDDGYGYQLAFSPDGRYLAAGADGVWRPTGRVDRTLRLWDLASAKEVLRYELAPGVAVSAMAFLPTGDKLLTAMRDTTLLVRDLTRPRDDESATPTALDALWADLADDDAGKAYRAIHALAKAGDRAVAFLKERLPPTPPGDAKRVEKLIADFDSDQFAVREAAAKELVKMGEAIAPLLQRALEGELSAEARRRIEITLARLDTGPLGEAPRAVRAIQVLETIGTAEARNLLHKLADGAPARQTREAKMVLERMKPRP